MIKIEYFYTTRIKYLIIFINRPPKREESETLKINENPVYAIKKRLKLISIVIIYLIYSSKWANFAN